MAPASSKSVNETPVTSKVRHMRRRGNNSMNEYGCERCWSSEATEAWEAVTSIPIETYLIDESHYIVSIRACPSCSQHYLQVTTETVDWEDGEDPIYRTVIPINDGERARLTNSTPLGPDILEGVGLGRRSLQYEWPKDQEPRKYWGAGVHVRVHD